LHGLRDSWVSTLKLRVPGGDRLRHERSIERHDPLELLGRAHAAVAFDQDTLCVGRGYDS